MKLITRFLGEKKKEGLAGISIVYGPNGSGKTTLARAIEGKKLEHSESVFAIFDDRSSKDVRQVQPHLYNEDFILDKFRITNDEVGALILLGDNVEHADTIEALSKENEKLETSIGDLAARQSVLEKSGKGSIKKARLEFTKALNARGWGENYRILTQRENAANFRDGKLDEIISVYDQLPANFEVDTCEEELSDTIGTIQRATSSRETSTIDTVVPLIDLKVDNHQINMLLQEVPPRIDGDELVKAVTMALADSKRSGVTSQSKNLIVDNHAEQCPLCFQSVDEPQRLLLMDALEKVYNQDREELEKRVQVVKDRLSLPTISLEHGVESILPTDKVQEFGTLNKIFELEKSKVQDSIQKKIKELETRTSVDLEPFLGALRALNQCIEDVNEFITTHNDTVRELEHVSTRALELNDLVCGYYARTQLQEYVKLKNELQKVSEELEQSRLQLANNSAKIDHLKSEANNTTDAVKLINRFLQIIFAEADRLTIAPVEHGYSVSCHGVRLQPGALSTGERNILSLAYFFASVFTSISDYNNPKEYRLVILDDPLSSFDEDNRYGVLLFIKQIADRIASKGGGQLIFFTHDARLVFNLNDAFKGINNAVVATWKLHNRELKSLNLNDSNKYKTILERILRFALLGTPHSPVRNEREGACDSEFDLLQTDIGNVPGSATPTGNEMRQVLEAFSEFNYGTDISNLLTHQLVKSALKHTGNDFSDYFRGSIYKLVLHGESHTRDPMKAGDPDFTPLAKEDDRVYLCREVICLISVLAPEHVISRLNLTRKNDDVRGLPDADEFKGYLGEWKQMMEDRALPTL